MNAPLTLAAVSLNVQIDICKYFAEMYTLHVHDRGWVVGPRVRGSGRCRVSVGIGKALYTRWLSFLRFCMTFPKDLFPITLSESNASIARISCRAGLYTMVRWKDPGPMSRSTTDRRNAARPSPEREKVERRQTGASIPGVKSRCPMRRSFPTSSCSGIRCVV